MSESQSDAAPLDEHSTEHAVEAHAEVQPAEKFVDSDDEPEESIGILDKIKARLSGIQRNNTVFMGDRRKCGPDSSKTDRLELFTMKNFKKASKESWLHVRIVEAKNLTSENGGSAPFCSMRIGSDGPVKLETQKRKNTLHPVWNESFTFMIRSIDYQRQLHIKVNDGRTFVGRAVINLIGLKNRPQFCGWFPLRDRTGQKLLSGSLYVKCVAQFDYNDETDITAPEFVEQRTQKLKMTDFGEEIVTPLIDTEEMSASLAAKLPMTAAVAALSSAAAPKLVRAASASTQAESESDDEEPPPPPTCERTTLSVCQWNLSSAAPPELSQWLPGKNTIVVVSAQECNYRVGQVLHDDDSDDDSDDKKKAEEAENEKAEPESSNFMQLCLQTLGKKYTLVKSTSIRDHHLAVFVRSDVSHLCSSVCTASTMLSLSNHALALSFNFHDTSFCVLSFSLHKQPSKFIWRNDQIKKIVESLQVGPLDSDPLNQFHHVIVTGDLNYRLEYGDNIDKPTATQFETICGDIKGNRFLSLYHQRDQLVRELSGGRVLNEFVDLQPNFKPTARLARGKSDYHHSSLPYWGGRVLYRSMRGFENVPGFAMQPNEFVSLPDIITRSKHTPIRASFDVELLDLPPSIDDNAPAACIAFRRLEGSNLNAADFDGLSDPYVRFMGTFLVQEERTPHIDCTLNPKWEDAALPTLQVQANSARRLKLHQLCFAAFDYDAASADDAIGLAYLPLKDYIQDGYPAISEWKDFNLDLTQGGLPAGQLKGQMQIFWRKL